MFSWYVKDSEYPITEELVTSIFPKRTVLKEVIKPSDLDKDGDPEDEWSFLSRKFAEQLQIDPNILTSNNMDQLIALLEQFTPPLIKFVENDSVGYVVHPTKEEYEAELDGFGGF